MGDPSLQIAEAVYSLTSNRELEQKKEELLTQIRVNMRYEERYCAKTKQNVKFTESSFSEVRRMVEKCRTVYHIEALRRFVVLEMVIPTNDAVNQRAHSIANSLLTGVPQ